MIERGWLGDKRSQGCYKRVGKDREIYAIDWKTLEYHPAAKPRFDSLESVRKIEPLSERLRALVSLDDKAGRFLWQALSDHVVYAAHMVPEISDRIVEIDRAMRWGYANALGPFELWDALGFEATARRIEAEGRALPENVQRMLSARARVVLSRGGCGAASHAPNTSISRRALVIGLCGTAARRDCAGGSETRARRGEEEPGRVADRSGRWRAVL